MIFTYVLAYLPPSNSSYTKKLDVDLIELIEKDISCFKQKGDVLICGDLNARTSTETDFIVNDSSFHLPLFDSCKPDDQIMFRKNMDENTDERGKGIVDLCISNQLRIVNGRFIGDLLGQYTCFNSHGQSTVDYLISNEELMNQLLYFKVSDFISDKQDKFKLAPIPFKWDENSGHKLQLALNSGEVKNMIKSFIENDIPDSQPADIINKKAEDLNTIFFTAAKNSLFRPRLKTCHRKKTKKK